MRPIASSTIPTVPLAKRFPLPYVGWCGLFVGVLVGPVPSFLGAGEPPGRVAELIRNLADDEFQTRQQATQELAELGPIAYDLVLKATSHDDPEVRQRAGYVASIIESAQQRAQLRRLRLGEPLTDSNLPGWSLFVSIAGDSHDSREFFATVLEQEWRLIASVLKEPATANEVILRRCSRVMVIPRGEGEGGGAGGPALIAAVLLLNCHEPLQLNYLALEKVIGQLQGVGYRGGSRLQGPFRSILAQSITRAQDAQTTADFLRLGVILEVPEVLRLAKQVLVPVGPPAVQRSDPGLLSTAMLVLRKFGGEEQVSWLEPHLEDGRPHPSMRGANVQVRDEALVTAMQLLVPEESNQGEPSESEATNLPFPNDEARQLALRKFREKLLSRKGPDKPAVEKP